MTLMKRVAQFVLVVAAVWVIAAAIVRRDPDAVKIVKVENQENTLVVYGETSAARYRLTCDKNAEHACYFPETRKTYHFDGFLYGHVGFKEMAPYNQVYTVTQEDAR